MGNIEHFSDKAQLGIELQYRNYNIELQCRKVRCL